MYILDFSPKKKKRKKQKNEIIFWGEDNCLPDEILELYTLSPTNQGILNRKQSLAKGTKLTFTNPDAEKFAKEIRFKELWSRCLMDYLVYGAFSVQVVKNFPQEIVSLKYQDVSQVRVGVFENEEKIVINSEWTSSAHYEEGNVFSQFNLENEIGGNHLDEWVSFLFKTRETLGNYTYPLPSWWSGKDSIETEINLIQYSKNLLNNSFTPTGILNFPATISPEEIKELKKQIKEEMTGVENAGKIVVVPSDGEKSITFTPLSQNIDSTQISNYLAFARQNIIIAHALPSPTIIGLPGGASLGGDGGTIESANEIFFNTDILVVQNELKEIFEYLFVLAGRPTQINIENTLIVRDEPNITN